MNESRLLKKDLFGEVRLESAGGRQQIVRDTSSAALPLHWLARGLMRREARVLAALDGLDGMPALVRAERGRLGRPRGGRGSRRTAMTRAGLWVYSRLLHRPMFRA